MAKTLSHEEFRVRVETNVSTLVANAVQTGSVEGIKTNLWMNYKESPPVVRLQLRMFLDSKRSAALVGLHIKRAAVYREIIERVNRIERDITP